MKRNINNIPSGYYCYDRLGKCPYHEIIKNKPYQENGYCHFLKKGDWDFQFNSLLWDSCKECNIFAAINIYDMNDRLTIREKFNYFIEKVKLWKTLSNELTIEDRVNIVYYGYIHLCKYCRKYFVSRKEVNLTDSCVDCLNDKN